MATSAVTRRAGTIRRAALAVGLVLLLSACQVIELTTGERVTKVLLVGDSVMAQNIESIRANFAKWGVQVEYVGELSTGPLWQQKEWARRLTTKLETYPADLVIFESCCHYQGQNEFASALYVNDEGVTVQPDTELMYEELEQANRELIDIAVAAGASPYWVKLPPPNAVTAFYGPTFPTRVNRYNDIVGTLGVPIVDWGTGIMSEPNWEELRYGDGIHFSAAGVTFLGRYTFTSTVKVVSST
jgi:hypothetical protein